MRSPWGFFRPERLPEYCFNAEEIHSGQYAGDGTFSGPVSGSSGGGTTLTVPDTAAAGDVLVLESGIRPARKKPPKGELVRAYEEGDGEAIKKARLTPEQLELIRRRCEENGKLGEQFVLDYERKRLRKLDREDLAGRVEWTSRLSVGEGYDIRSFEKDGTDRLIEVKTTESTGRTFVITSQEWATAARLGSRYWIYRVTGIRGTPKLIFLQDPVKLEIEERLKRSADRWKVTIV
jgi:hypothetical protein